MLAWTLRPWARILEINTLYISWKKLYVLDIVMNDRSWSWNYFWPPIIIFLHYFLKNLSTIGLQWWYRAIFTTDSYLEPVVMSYFHHYIITDGKISFMHWWWKSLCDSARAILLCYSCTNTPYPYFFVPGRRLNSPLS